MNLTVYTRAREARKDARGIVSEDAIGASQKTITGVRKLELDFDRSVFRVEYASPTGRQTEYGELSTLYPEGQEMPDDLFNFNSTASDKTAKQAVTK